MAVNKVFNSFTDARVPKSILLSPRTYVPFFLLTHENKYRYRHAYALTLPPRPRSKESIKVRLSKRRVQQSECILFGFDYTNKTNSTRFLI